METTAPAATRGGIEIPSPGTWELDPAHTSVGFVARYMGLSKVRGRFNEFSGAIHVGPTPEESWVEVSIDPTSVDTSMPMRDNHLRSGDFFAVDEHPAITFRSTKVEQVGEASLKVTGDLTIRGVTRPVVLDVEYAGVGQHPAGGTRAGFTATTEIDRYDFGVSWNQALETGGLLVGKKVRIELDVQAKSAAQTAAA